MKSILDAMKSKFTLGKNQSSQSAEVIGNNNNIDQSINIYVADSEDFRKAMISKFELPEVYNWQKEIKSETECGDDSQEFQLISKCREVANRGDITAALSMLEALKNDERLKTGFSAFRLSFNIGILLQDIGEYGQASAELRRAFSFCSDHPKAIAGRALADLIDGRYDNALEQARSLLTTAGDHVNLCATIALNAAKNLRVNFNIKDFEYVDVSNDDVIIALLDYTEIVHPEEFEPMLKEAMAAAPDNQRLTITWAHAFLKDARQNQAFLLGAKMVDGFEEDVSRCASALVAHLEISLAQNPPNLIFLPSEVNNAALALRLSGKEKEAAALLDRVLARFPQFTKELAQLKAVLLLQQDREAEALELISDMTDKAEFQVMASEIEAKIGDTASALVRINSVLRETMPDALRCQALVAKARIGFILSDRCAVDEAIDELNSDFATSPDLLIIKSAYSRVFEFHPVDEDSDNDSVMDGSELDVSFNKNRDPIDKVSDLKDWDFVDVLRVANELFNRGSYRKCCDLLRGRVSFSHESMALQILCDACIRGGMVSLAKDISDRLPSDIKNSSFGWKFGANASILTGDVAKAIPLTRKLFLENQTSLSSLRWYIQSLLRVNDKSRICRVVKSLNDAEMYGTVQEKREYASLLGFCGEIERSRSYSYRLFCAHPNDHHSWMSLSASVLALGAQMPDSKERWLKEVNEDAAIEVMLPSGETRKYIIENDEFLFPLRAENISSKHPIAQSLLRLKQGDVFDWPLKGQSGTASVISIKHKVLDAFHFVMQRFEENFPDAGGLTSIRCDPAKENGLEEIIGLLKQRAQYGEGKIEEYKNGSTTLGMLGVALGLDPIDIFLSIYREARAKIKVSSCKIEDQDNASSWLKLARKNGLLLDALSVYLLRRLDLTDVIQREFGKIGITQVTIDVYTRRLHEAQNMGSYDESGRKQSKVMSFRDGRIVVSSFSEEEITEKVNLHQDDLDWLHETCEVIPAVSKEDPDDEIIQVRRLPGGQFLDDFFACDGSDRVLVSDDLHLRQWGQGLFSIKSVWIQAILFHLEERGLITPQKVVSATISLLEAGEQALSINSFRLLTGAEMLCTGEITEKEFDLLSSVVGQPGAEMTSHLRVVMGTLDGLWRIGSLSPIRYGAASIVLRNLVRHQGSNSAVVIDTIQAQTKLDNIRKYVEHWRTGHFIPRSTPSET